MKRVKGRKSFFKNEIIYLKPKDLSQITRKNMELDIEICILILSTVLLEND